MIDHILSLARGMGDILAIDRYCGWSPLEIKDLLSEVGLAAGGIVLDSDVIYVDCFSSEKQVAILAW